MSFLARPRTRGNRGPPAGPPAKDAAPQWPGRGPRPEAAAPSPAPPSGPARRSRQAPAPARRPRCAVPPPARPRLPGALQSAHTSARGPFRDILSGDAAAALWASVGGAGGGPGRRRPLLPGPAPARPRLGSARPANRPPPGLARNLPCPPARSPSGALRPAPPRAAPPPLAARRSLSPPPARLRAAPAGSGAGPAHRGRGSLHTRPAARPCGPRLPEKGSRERGREGAGTLKGAAAAARQAREGGVACGPGLRSCAPRPRGSVSYPHSSIPFAFQVEGSPGASGLGTVTLGEQGRE